MLRIVDRYWSFVAFLGLSTAYLLLCPFNKVEESFNTQAIHDLLFNWPTLSKFDHLEFPGVVPRTFIGAIFTALLTKLGLVGTMLSGYHLNKFQIMLVLRFMLALLSTMCWFRFQRAIHWRFGSICSNLFALLSITQFHSIFYASRTLPNTFAVSLTLLGYAAWLKGRSASAVAWLTICAVIFRFEVAIILASLFLSESLTQPSKFKPMFKTGLISGLSALTTTVLVDSFFWRRWLWPEAEVFHFNVVMNKSSEWGTQPWNWYLQKALPNALLLAYPFAILGLFRSSVKNRYFVPSLAFLAIFSCLPHKELRFIFYILPMFNLMAASSITNLSVETGKRSRSFKTLLNLAFIAIAGLCLFSSAARALISSRNYPGGEAMIRLHSLVKGHHAKVHIDVYSAMNGVSRFLEFNSNWTYDKTEHLEGEDFRQFTHLLTSTPIEGFTVIDTINGFNGIKLNIPKSPSDLMDKFPFLSIKEEPKIYIMAANPIGQPVEL